MLSPVAAAPPARPAAPPSSLPIASQPPEAPAPGTQVRIDTALRLVVVEFREPDGEVRQSIPTPKEIDAYRNPPLPAPPKPAPGAIDVSG
ncbi:hypothetical protein [Falsiroseomonas selenitidurans]|uniref:Uncharacterized protein n=1 Tax=Falsiroseomonas selenitidurans TaxID=2716335 RepID=A0ABX1EAH5_9PROT|nr:hypothetical protein [Falsiroseomonas selenitidurans]NKC34202.1 hypothetical protein [Falsiroseomonas selenitidurans]